eukprot:s7767_g1.t3
MEELPQQQQEEEEDAAGNRRAVPAAQEPGQLNVIQSLWEELELEPHIILMDTAVDMKTGYGAHGASVQVWPPDQTPWLSDREVTQKLFLVGKPEIPLREFASKLRRYNKFASKLRRYNKVEPKAKNQPKDKKDKEPKRAKQTPQCFPKAMLEQVVEAGLHLYPVGGRQLRNLLIQNAVLPYGIVTEILAFWNGKSLRLRHGCKGNGSIRTAGSADEAFAAISCMSCRLLKEGQRRAEGMRDDDITTTVSCPVRRVGALIGKAGATIIQLRKETGASIEVERSDGKEPREVTISGSDSAVKDAVQRIHDLIHRRGDAPTRRRSPSSEREAATDPPAPLPGPPILHPHPGWPPPPHPPHAHPPPGYPPPVHAPPAQPPYAHPHPDILPTLRTSTSRLLRPAPIVIHHRSMPQVQRRTRHLRIPTAGIRPLPATLFRARRQLQVLWTPLLEQAVDGIASPPAPEGDGVLLDHALLDQDRRLLVLEEGGDQVHHSRRLAIFTACRGS